MKAGPLNPEWEAKKEEAKKLIAAGACSALKYWSNTDAVRLCPNEHEKEVKFEPLEGMVYISEWEDAAKKAIELIQRGLALIQPKSKQPTPPSLPEGRGEDWEAIEIRRRIDEQKAARQQGISALVEKAFLLGYFNQANPPASFVDDIADGHLKEAWERCKPELLAATPPAPSTESEKEDRYTRDEVKLMLSQRESYFMNHQNKDRFLTSDQWLDKNYTQGLHLLRDQSIEQADLKPGDYNSIWDAWDGWEAANKVMNGGPVPNDPPYQPENIRKNYAVIKMAAAERGAKWMREALQKKLASHAKEVSDLRSRIALLEAELVKKQGHLSRYQKSAGDMKFMVESDPVNWVLANALKLLTPEQMIYLSDALYERSPHPQGRWSDRVKSLESKLKASKEEAGEWKRMYTNATNK